MFSGIFGSLGEPLGSFLVVFFRGFLVLGSLGTSLALSNLLYSIFAIGSSGVFISMLTGSLGELFGSSIVFDSLGEPSGTSIFIDSLGELFGGLFFWVITFGSLGTFSVLFF
jgi:hypothetical protein